MEIDSLCEALVFDFERTPSGHLDVRPAIASLRLMLGNEKPVTVLRFTKEWGALSIEDGLADLLKKSTASRATIPAEVPEVINLCVCVCVCVCARARVCVSGDECFHLLFLSLPLSQLPAALQTRQELLDAMKERVLTQAGSCLSVVGAKVIILKIHCLVIYRVNMGH